MVYNYLSLIHNVYAPMKIISLRNLILLLMLILMPDIFYASGNFSVQAGAFSSKNNAQNVVCDLQQHGIQCAIHEQKGLFKIHCGEFGRKTEANALRKKISSLGYDAFVIPKITQVAHETPRISIPEDQSSKALLPAETKPERPLPSKVSAPTTVAQPIPTEEKRDVQTQAQKQEIMTESQGPILLDRVVAVVNKEVVTWSELYKAMEFEATAQIKNLVSEERKKVFKQSEATFLESLIDARLQLQEAQRIALGVTQNEITETIETIQKKYSMTEAEFTESLKKEGLNLEEYKRRLSEQILINKVVTHEIRNKIVVSDDAIKNYMEEHKANLSGDEKYRLRQIFFKKPGEGVDKNTVEEKAALIIRRLKDGEDFSALAWIYSDDPSRKMGGDLGFIDRHLMGKEFVEVLSTMNVGDYSMPFWTEQGLHIIKLDEVVSVQNIDKVREDVRKKLAEEQFTARYRSWVKGLREKAYIEVRL